jgi:hypothetical protein
VDYYIFELYIFSLITMASSATKRTFVPDTTEISEPADHKSKVIVTAVDGSETTVAKTVDSKKQEHSSPKKEAPQPHKFKEPETKSTKRDESPAILKQAASKIRAPIPFRQDFPIAINLTHYEPWFNSLYVSIFNKLYPSGGMFHPGIITQANFVVICKVILYSRVGDVYAAITGRRPDQRVTISKRFIIPKALADIVNGIGLFIAYHGIRVYPVPPTFQNDDASRPMNVWTMQRLEPFDYFIKLAVDEHVIRPGTLANTPEGTGWWILSARLTDNNIAQGNANVVNVKGIFANWTPSDGMMAAIVQNRFTGLIADFEQYTTTTTAIRGIPALRNRFNLEA